MSNETMREMMHEVNMAASLYNFNTDTKKTESHHQEKDPMVRELTDISLLYNLEQNQA